jgi:hypothetical protein
MKDIRPYRRMTLWELEEEIGISTGSRHAILTQDLRMHQVSAKFVPMILTEDQRIQRIPVCEDLLRRPNGNGSFQRHNWR